MHATDMMQYGHMTLLTALKRIRPEDVDIKSACGVWSVKDLVVHLTQSELMLIDAINYIKGETDLHQLKRARELGDQYNDQTVAESQGKSYDQVVAEYKAAFEQSTALMELVDVDTRRKKGTIPWYGEDYDLEDFMVYTTYAHKREHGAHIAAFADIRGT